MTPVSFGPCFGWLHPGNSTTGVVLCGAHPFEQLSAHRAWRDLAERLAALGYPTLRFDYPGAGDSLDPPGGATLSDWSVGVEDAARWMRRSVGVSRLILVGLRLGGALAAQVAIAGGVDGIALLAPVMNGRAYVRELAATAAMVGMDRAEDGFELGGFPVGEAMAQAIRSIDLTKLAWPSGLEVLVLTPATQAREKAVAALRLCGARVAEGPFDRLSEFLEAPTFSRPPSEAFDALAQWALARFPPTQTAPAAKPILAPRALRDRGFVEEAAFFGASGLLFGVFCQPSGQEHDSAVVFLNSGANSHVGWARMTVDHARALARAGTPSLRMDIAGLGDSASAGQGGRTALYSLDRRGDVAEAIDWLRERGMRRIVVVGLCSGAHLAFHAAVADARIDGLVIANVQRFIWREGDSLEVATRQGSRSSNFYRREILKPRTWTRLLKGEIAVAGIVSALASRGRRMLMEKLAFRSRGAAGEDIRGGFEAIARRGSRVLAIFSEGDPGIDELAIYMSAGGRRLRRLAGAEIAFIANADHNLTPRPARDRFLTLIDEFVTKVSLRAERDSNVSNAVGMESLGRVQTERMS